MLEEIKRPFNEEELAAIEKAAHALVIVRPILSSHGLGMLCVSEVIVLFWAISDETHNQNKLKT